MESKDTGLLLNPKNIKLQRVYFKQMCGLIGLNVKYRAPRADKNYNGYGELNTLYCEPETVGCIFEEHPNQWTARKLGWDAELQENMSIIHLPYDLKGLQIGALVDIPSAIDCAPARTFRVVKMSTIAVYPASIACMIAPEYESTFERSQLSHKDSNFNLLAEEGGD